MSKRLILASGSKGRAMILRDAGLAFDQIVSDVDEDALKLSCQKVGKTLDETALALAHAKAKKVSDQEAGFVIGADQIMGLDGEGFDKPKSLQEAHERLILFAGKTHYLYTGLVVYKNGRAVFEHITAPAMTMRPFTPDQILAYLKAAGPDVLKTVGAYMLEAEGSRLFSKIEGDYFSIIGLPLLPLTTFLRDHLALEY